MLIPQVKCWMHLNVFKCNGVFYSVSVLVWALLSPHPAPWSFWLIVPTRPGIKALTCRRLPMTPKCRIGVLSVCACSTNVAAVARQQHGEPRHRGGSLHFNNKTNVISPQNEVSLLIDSWGVSIILFNTSGVGIFGQWGAKVRWAAGLLSASTKKLLIYCGAWLELTHSTTLFHRFYLH